MTLRELISTMTALDHCPLCGWEVWDKMLAKAPAASRQAMREKHISNHAGYHDLAGKLEQEPVS